MDDTLLTTKQAAELLGLTPGTVRVYCRRYDVGTKRGRDLWLTPADVETLRNRRTVMGRPRKPKENADA